MLLESNARLMKVAAENPKLRTSAKPKLFGETKVAWNKNSNSQKAAENTANFATNRQFFAAPSKNLAIKDTPLNWLKYLAAFNRTQPGTCRLHRFPHKQGSVNLLHHGNHLYKYCTCLIHYMLHFVIMRLQQ